MTTIIGEKNTREVQAQRLERVYEQMATLLRQPEVAGRLQAANDEGTWSAMQVLGHMVEMIPYWLSHCRAIIAAEEPYPFGRTMDAPERLAGVKQGTIGEPEPLLAALQKEVEAAGRAIREMSPAERDRTGVHGSRGEMRVAEIIEVFIVAHAEDHLEQVRAALDE